MDEIVSIIFFNRIRKKEFMRGTEVRKLIILRKALYN